MDVVPELRDPDRRLALAYVPTAARPAVAVLWALDERLAAIVAQAREPMIGLMRLTWWRDRLDALADGAPAEPLLRACAAAGLHGPALAAMVAGWEALLDDPALGDEAVAQHACERGGRLFALTGALLSPGSPEAARLVAAGEGWASADLARHLDSPARAEAIRARAGGTLRSAMAARWPRALRPVSTLAALAAADLDGTASPRRRAFRVLRHQFSGR